MPQQSSYHFNDGIVCYSSSQAPVISTSESSKTLCYRWYPYLTHASSVAYSSAFLPDFQLAISLFLMPINALYLLIPISHFTLIYTCTYSIHIHTVHKITCVIHLLYNYINYNRMFYLGLLGIDKQCSQSWR